VLGALDAQLLLGLALLALQSKRDLLGGLGLLMEDRLGLTSETHLLVVVSALSLWCRFLRTEVTERKQSLLGKGKINKNRGVSTLDTAGTRRALRRGGSTRANAFVSKEWGD
jgi:hypothetical protein